MPQSISLTPNENPTEVILKISDKSFHYSSRALLVKNGEIRKSKPVLFQAYFPRLKTINLKLTRHSQLRSTK